jgi:hypothetical protein
MTRSEEGVYVIVYLASQLFDQDMTQESKYLKISPIFTLPD